MLKWKVGFNSALAESAAADNWGEGKGVRGGLVRRVSEGSRGGGG